MQMHKKNLTNQNTTSESRPASDRVALRAITAAVVVTNSAKITTEKDCKLKATKVSHISALTGNVHCLEALQTQHFLSQLLSVN